MKLGVCHSKVCCDVVFFKKPKTLLIPIIALFELIIFVYKIVLLSQDFLNLLLKKQFRT